MHVDCDYTKASDTLFSEFHNRDQPTTSQHFCVCLWRKKCLNLKNHALNVRLCLTN